MTLKFYSDEHPEGVEIEGTWTLEAPTAAELERAALLANDVQQVFVAVEEACANLGKIGEHLFKRLATWERKSRKFYRTWMAAVREIGRPPVKHRHGPRSYRKRWPR